MIRSSIVLAISAAILASCSVTTPVLKQDLELPSSYHTSSVDSVHAKLQPWKVFYQDTCLASLLHHAVRNNFSSRLALARLEVAGANYAYATGALLPKVDVVAKGSAERFGEYTMNGIGNDDTNRSETLPTDKRLPNPYPEIFTGLSFSWEANLWGKLSNQRAAARNRYLASRELTRATRSWLLGAVAENYYELLGLDQEKDVLEKNIVLQRLAFEMAKIQKEGGKVNQLAVDQFEAQLLNTQTRRVAIEQTIRATEATINQLLGRFPQPINRYSIQQEPTLFQLHAGTPQQLLSNRPDIRQRELLLQAAHADVDVARAAFYPALRLSAGAGFAAFDFSKLLLTPGSAVYNVGAGLSAPLLQRKQIKAAYAAASARQRVALLDYEQTLLTAFNEVYIVSANDNNLARQIEVKEHEVQVQQHAHTSASDLFSVGFASYLEVITAQRRLLEVELELTELRMQRLKNHTLLYRALGGGWQGDDE